MFIDSHAHLDGPEFDADRDAVLARARDGGLVYLLLIAEASAPDSLARTLELAERHDWIFAAAGVHPHEAAKAASEHFARLRELAAHPKFLAIGEIGLDYHYDHSPRDVQQRVLASQLTLAAEVSLPVIIHCREAWADFREIVCGRSASHQESAAASARAGILHCFSGTEDDARDLVARGYLVSFAGNLTFKNAENLRHVARTIPPDRLLTETDCPYLAPIPHRGRRNEPAYVVEITRELARLHSVTHEAMAQRVRENFERFFRLPPLQASPSTHR